MGTAAEFSKALHEHTGAYAAWLPVANRYELGDYGIISDGVFQRLGHVGDFSVTFQTSEPSPAASINFTSGATRVVKLVGGAEVTALPEAPVEASLRVEFGGSASSMVKAAEVSVTEIVDLQQVTTALANADGWKRRWRVVRSLWTAHNCAIAISSGKNAHFELAGKAEALKQLDLGSVNAGVTVVAENNVGFSSLGKTGVVGLGLFKVSWIGGRTRFLDAGEVQVQVDEDDALESDL